MDGGSSTGDQVEVDVGVFEQFLDNIPGLDVDGQLDGQPTVAGALVDVGVQAEQLIEDLVGLTEDRVVEGAPSFFAQFVNKVHFLLPDLD